ncbi:MAG: hypothetical protein DLM50_08560 [Candidatus Meridianibacter frigidus]|nr:MAG: hypothetical protein DLM50_08560 [Candidatus Eremiobacteraeota bacterium]
MCSVLATDRYCHCERNEVKSRSCDDRWFSTLVATVLSESDERDPLSDAARSLLDGHIASLPRWRRQGIFRRSIFLPRQPHDERCGAAGSPRGFRTGVQRAG